MPFIIKLAFRNILRHTRRSIITAVAIMLMIALFIIIKSFLDGSEKQVLSTITKQSGHIQIHQLGYASESRSLPLDIAMENPELIITSLKDPHIKMATERIRFMTLISNGDKTVAAMGMGIVSDNEAKISDLNTKIISGEYKLSGNKAIIGSGLAASLHADIGSVLTLVTNTSYNSMNAVDVEIAGIVRTGLSQLDDSAVFIDMPYAQTLLAMPDRATEIIIRLDDANNTNKVMTDIESQLDLNHLEIESWREINKAWLGIFDIRAKFVGIIMIVVMIVGGTSIFNTIVMAVSERTREVGTLLALGLHKRDIVLTFMLEAAGIGVLGSIAGVILGGGLVGYLSVSGIRISSNITDIGIPISDILYPVLDVNSILYAFIFGIFISVLSSILPAFSASKLKPIDALRHV